MLADSVLNLFLYFGIINILIILFNTLQTSQVSHEPESPVYVPYFQIALMLYALARLCPINVADLVMSHRCLEYSIEFFVLTLQLVRVKPLSRVP